MPNEFDSPIDRRLFLRLGLLGGVLVAGGCGGAGDTAQPVTTPPVAGGNRQRLEAAQGKGDAAATKKD
jgi:hypothetical protein